LPNRAPQPNVGGMSQKSASTAHGFEDEIFTFAVAQIPFETPSLGGTTTNVFCTVVPLWHEDWEPARSSQFPNNGLVWWKLRPAMREFATPGRLLSARVQPAPRYDPEDANKQFYQLVTDDVDVLSPEEGIEVLTADPRTVADARDLLNREGVLQVDHAPTPEVMVRLGTWIYGPFRSRVSAVQKGKYRISLDPIGTAGVQRMETSRIEPAILRLHDVPISTDSLPPTRSSNIALCRYEVLDGGSLAEYRKGAEHIVITRDQDVLLRLARRFEDAGDRRQLIDLLTRLSQHIEETGEDEAGERDLIDALKRQAQQQGQGALEVARAVLSTGLLDTQIHDAVAALARERLNQRAAELEESARERIATLEADAERLEARRDNLESEIRTRLREAEDLTQQRIDEAWAQHSRRVAEEEARFEQEIAAHRGWQPPEFATAAREPTQVGEREFFDRFVEHVEASGFSFRDIDLQMYHVFFKSTEVMLVAGATGSGRSSIVELYAESLAASELRATGPHEPVRFLRVPVRASWIDAADIFGHVNPLTHAFMPAPNGCFTQLISAAEEYMLHRGGSGVYPILLEDANPATMASWFGEVVRAARGGQRQRLIRVFSPHAIDPQSPFRRWSTVEVSPAVRWIITVPPQNGAQTFDAAGCPVLHLAGNDDLATGGASRGAPDGPPVRWSQLAAWRGDGPLSTAQVAALDAITPPLARAGAAPAPAMIRLLRRITTGASSIVSPDTAFDYTVAHGILRFAPLDTRVVSELLDVVDDLRIRLAESARVLEERRVTAERHGI